MIKAVMAIAAVAAASLIAVANGSSASPPSDVTCSQVTNSFSGTAYDLIVPANGGCHIESATITNDLIAEHDSGVSLTNSTVGTDVLFAHGSSGTITNSTVGGDAVYVGHDGGGDDITGSTIGHNLSYGSATGGNISDSKIGYDLTVGLDSFASLTTSQVGHDLTANRPNSIQTGCSDPTASCTVRIGNDFVIDGSPGRPDPGAFVFDGMCDLSVGHDLRITNRWVTLGLGLGDGCIGTGSGPITVGHDLVFYNNTALTGFFGPSSMSVVNAKVGHDLTVTGNSATDTLQVSGDTVGKDATCRGNNPPASLDSLGPNSIGGTNNGCP